MLGTVGVVSRAPVDYYELYGSHAIGHGHARCSLAGWGVVLNDLALQGVRVGGTGREKLRRYAV